jgi:uncharacterized protein YjdB
MAYMYAGCTGSGREAAPDRLSRLTRFIRLTTYFLALVLLAAATACDKGVTESGGSVADLTVTPPSGQTEVGGDLQLSAEFKDAAGNSLPGRAVFWASSDSSIATVSAAGLVRGRAVGVAQIAASAEGRSALATVRVVPRGVASVRIESAGSTLTALADTVRFRAVALDASGNELPGRAANWSSADGGVAVISSDGVATAVGNGMATIRAEIGGIVGTATLSVDQRVARIILTPASVALALGGSAQLGAEALDANSFPVAGTNIRWGSSNATIAHVDATGLVTGVSTGQATITAVAGGVEASASAAVALVPVGSVEVRPAALEVRPGEAVTLTAVVRDERGNVLSGRAVNWTSSDPAVVAVDAQGRATGVQPGSAVVTASSGGRSGGATVMVPQPAPAAAARVEITPANPSLLVGGDLQLVAIARDANGNVLSGRSVSWASSNPAVVAVNGSGVARGVAPGSATVTATVEGKNGTARVTISSPPPVPVASVEVSPPSGEVQVGAKLQLTATANDASGNALAGRDLNWTSSDPAVASVNGSGLVTGVAPGQATITVTAEGKRATTQIAVVPVPVASVQISAPSHTLRVGESAQFRAAPRDNSGNPLTGRPVSWSSSDPSVAIVSQNGRVTAIAAGDATITASSEGKSGTTNLQVTPAAVASVEVSPAAASLVAGGSFQLNASVRDAANRALAGRTVSWTSSNPAVATVDEKGLVRGIAPGEATVTATSEGRSGTANITISSPPPVPVSSVRVTPSSGEAVVGSTLQLSATARDASGNPLTGRAITWSSSDPAVARVDETGLVSGLAAGTAVISATSEGRIGTADVRIRPVPINSIDVTPPSATVAVGEATQLSATARDAAGVALAGRQIEWTSSDPSIAAVNANGLVRSVAPGVVTITASAEGVRGTAAITVTAQPVASVEVNPASQTVQVGQSVQLTATPRNAAGAALANRQVSWSSSNSAVAAVDADGTVRGVAAGTATITATSEGRSGTAAITVSPAPPLPVASVVVTPPSSQIGVGSTVSLNATTRDAAGNTLTGRAVTWTSSDPAVATVDGSGLVRGVAAGDATITATSEGRSGTAQVTVRPVPVASVDVSPSTGTVQVGNTTQLTATVRDAAGNVLSGRPIAWSTSNASVATVDASGQVSGVAAGSATITATVEGRTGTSSITVTPAPPAPPAPVAVVEVNPASQTVQIGQAVQLTATPRDAAGNALTGRAIVWTSSNPAVAVVDGSGLVRGVAPGTTTIRATSEGVTGTAQITVAAPVPAAPARLVYVSGSGQTGRNNQALPNPLVVRVLDASGNPVAGVSVSWSSDRGEVSPTTSVTDAQGYTSTVWTLRGGPKNRDSFAWAEVRGLPRVQFTARRQ